jgi:hypothetical protein
VGKTRGGLVKPTPYACQPKNKAAKTPLRGILLNSSEFRIQNSEFSCEEIRVAADEVENRSQVTSVVLYFVWVRISPYKPP